MDHAARRRGRVLPAGGSSPRWVRNARELVFIDGNGWLAAAAFTPGDPPAVAPPRPLFHARDRVQKQFAVTPDGETVVLIQETGDDSTPIVVQLGWQTPREQRADR